MAEEVREYLLYNDRFLQQAGDGVARYVWASPGAPVKVKLSTKVLKFDKKLGKKVLIDRPEESDLRLVPRRPIVDVRPNVNQQDTAPMNTARALDTDDDEDGEGPGLRAADQL